jgi:hypothetical protein
MVDQLLDQMGWNYKAAKTEIDRITSPVERQQAKERKLIQLQLEILDKEILERLISVCRLSGNQLKRVRLLLYGGQIRELTQRPCSSLSMLKEVLETANGMPGLEHKLIIEVGLGKRRYPAELHWEYQGGYASFPAGIEWTAKVVLGDCSIELMGGMITVKSFECEEGGKLLKSFEELLAEREVKLIYDREEAFGDMDYLNAEALSVEQGKQLACSGSGLVVYTVWWFKGLNAEEFGSVERPTRVITENKIELSKNEERMDRRRVKGQMLPLVRCFSLDRKLYGWVDVRDLKPYDWEVDAQKNLVLEPHVSSILSRLFKIENDQLFGDTIKGKHGGMVIMAAGEPGVGKTATAEVFAESTKRPLYQLEVAELGTSLAAIEENLKRIFMRVQRWNAVLLLDEADVFMAKRGQDLERSAIVGVFLRMLDYYPGTLFLTTNRPEIIDEAFKSRITLQLDYPKLTTESRGKIWKLMVQKAEIKVEGIEKLAELELNGRQIRNLVRLMKALHAGKNQISLTEAQEVCKFSVK